MLQTEIMGMFLDRSGCIWVGSAKGASKFNGQDFQNYTEKEGLLIPGFTYGFEDPEGRFWFFTNNYFSVIKKDTTINFIKRDLGLDENDALRFHPKYGILFIPKPGNEILKLNKEMTKLDTLVSDQRINDTHFTYINRHNGNISLIPYKSNIDPIVDISNGKNDSIFVPEYIHSNSRIRYHLSPDNHPVILSTSGLYQYKEETWTKISNAIKYTKHVRVVSPKKWKTIYP